MTDQQINQEFDRIFATNLVRCFSKLNELEFNVRHKVKKACKRPVCLTFCNQITTVKEALILRDKEPKSTIFIDFDSDHIESIKN